MASLLKLQPMVTSRVISTTLLSITILLLLVPKLTLSASISDYSPQLHLTFDDVLTDSTANGNTATIYNTPSYATGARNNGLDLESSLSQYATIADSANTRVNDLWTVSYWFKPESLTNWQEYIGQRSGENGFGNLSYSTGRLDVETGSGSFGGTQITSLTLTTATWYHICSMYNGASSKVYVNGTLYNISTNAITPPNTTLYLGRNPSSASYYADGVIDELTIFDTDESSNCTTLYNSGVPLPYESTSTSSTSTTATSTSFEDDNIVFSLALIVFFLASIWIGLVFSAFRKV